ncbi:MAG: c-type cytochrome [Verrucomicrobiaceae bacterium]|nr:c-type cytochrome [Verrucomicrobiaceae bacterium]
MSDENSIKGLKLLESLGVHLEGYGLLQTAIQDASPYVRREALRIRPQALLGEISSEHIFELRPEAAQLLSDTDLTVAIEAIHLHAFVSSPASLDVIGDLCVKHQYEPHLLRAALLANGSFPGPQMAKAVLSQNFDTSLPLQDFASECMKMLGRRCKDVPVNDAPFYAAQALQSRKSIDSITVRLMADLGAELRKSGVSLQDFVFEHFHDDRNKIWRQELIDSVLNTLANSKAAPSDRINAIRLLPDTGGSAEAARLSLASLLTPNNDPTTITTALEALGAYWEPVVADAIIEAWPTLTPPLREKAVTQLLMRADHVSKLLDAIENKTILPSQITAAAKATLGRQKLPYLKERIAKLIGDGSSANRKEVIDKYASVMTMAGDAARGAKIYETACMVCHKFADKGNDVGPHLGTIKAWTADQLVTNILDPNREVSPNFALYLVETNDGRTLSGLITSETAGNLTLKRADGGTDTVLRSEIKTLTSPGISLMPEGLEAAITPQQMADLIAFLKQP